MKDNVYESASRTNFRNAGAVFSMLIGCLLMVLLVVTFNKGIDKKEDAVKRQTRILKIEKTEKKVAQKQKPEKKPEPKPKTAPQAPPPDLGAIIGGIAMDIPEFAAANIAGDDAELLDEIAEDTVMTEGTVDQKPQVAFRGPIEYPASAATSGIQGYVIVNLLISKDGSVELTKLLEAEPQGVFEDSVLVGIRDWRFTPARYKGEPVPVWVRQKISFNT